MEERLVVVALDGYKGPEIEVISGLPQGSAVSPILFTVYIADIHSEVEGKINSVRALSFVDDITWLAVGDDVAELTKKLEQCAKLSKRWAENNAVEFELAKTEAILFSKKEDIRRCRSGHHSHNDTRSLGWDNRDNRDERIIPDRAFY
jgi:hypothetical protein